MSHTTVRTVPVTLALVASIAATAPVLMSGSAGASPAPLAWTVVASERPSLTAGGSVYDSQVPSAARAADTRNRGSVYDSQVPAAARRG
jgi:hypothetical protein